MSFESQLENFLNDCKKLIVLGVGNELKSDDGVGPFIISKLKQENMENDSLLFIDAQTVPENFTGKIRKENPTHLIIVDACLMDSNADIGISTHSMSLSFFVKFLEKDSDLKIIFVGIEPKTMEWANAPTPKVQEAANNFIKTLKGIIL